MAVTDNTVGVGVGLPKDRTYFCASIYTANASGGEEIEAAVTYKSIYLEKLTIHSQFNDTFSILAGAAILFGPFTTLSGVYGVVQLEFKRPIKLPASTALNVTQGTGSIICVIAEGYIAV